MISQTSSSYTQSNVPALYGDSSSSFLARLKERYYNSEIYLKYFKHNIGLCFLFISQFFNSLMFVFVKLLENDKNFNTPLSSSELIFVRMSFTVVCSAVYMYYMEIPHFPFGAKEVRHLLLLRGSSGFLWLFGSYYALHYISLSDSIVIEFISPCITLALAYVLLKERYSIWEALSGLFSMIGVLLIARPSFLFSWYLVNNQTDEDVETKDPKVRLLATSVLFFGILGGSFVTILIRSIGNRAHPLLSVQYYSGVSCIVSCLIVIFKQSETIQLPKTIKHWIFFFLLGASGFINQVFMTAGIQREKAGRASLVSYTQMIYALVWELTIWHHVPPLLSWIGFVIIISSAISAVLLKQKEEQQDQTETLLDDDELSHEMDTDRNTVFHIDDANSSDNFKIPMTTFKIEEEEEEETSNLGKASEPV
ncbi:hypothetical protein PACTADRAFT_48329 [Pachysolen tannophilus NRRL Y-2460]|uniref:EamA domain-containing protein n=1 Tax=Pachysolen tannophilus NRRL Y-2460 TaxID=669874 RepID=A0A1E4U3P9_PACTA|nr:hypothetical protein PACTADRAFT_48329 [Pachysolen tannophilus NRRL Y-2460]